MPPKQPARKINGVAARTITAGIVAMKCRVCRWRESGLDFFIIPEEKRTKIKMIGGRVINTFFVHSRMLLVILKTTKKISVIPRNLFVPEPELADIVKCDFEEQNNYQRTLSRHTLPHFDGDVQTARSYRICFEVSS